MKAITNGLSNVLTEQLVPDHLFVYVVKGSIRFFDGNESYTYREGDCCIARKNHLIKFIFHSKSEDFTPMLFCFDEDFLRQFQAKHPFKPAAFKSGRAIIDIDKSDMLESFIQSLKPYHKGVMQYDEAFEDLKYQELLTILMKHQPGLSGIFFDFAAPEKVNLEAFMQRSFRFNISLQQFAFLTGRSLSAFKRDFKAVFDETPSRWLTRKRLKESYFLIEQKGKSPSDFYLDLGFESLSHFSVAFKKEFGIAPTALKVKHT